MTMGPMGIFRPFAFIAILAAGPAIAAATASGPVILSVDEAQRLLPAIRRKAPKALASVPVRYRSKNKPQRRRLKANRLHISRRVRRKHRRARAA